MFLDLRRSAVAQGPRNCQYELRRSLWRLLGKTCRTVTVQTRQRRFTVSCADKVIGSNLYCDRQFELDLTLRVVAHLRHFGRLPSRGHGTILDIGANMGVISIGMLYLDEMVRGIAIEPEPTNFALLERNVAQNGFGNRLICLPCAASDRAGEVPFELSEHNYGDHRVRMEDCARVKHEQDRYGENKRHVVSVRADRLDDLLPQVPGDWSDDIKLIWIDTQGHEEHVFLGGEKLFSRDIPVVTEIWPYGLRRAGTSQEDFCRSASRFWSHYWVWRHNKFVQYPIGILDLFFDELGPEGDHDHDNVIFTQ